MLLWSAVAVRLGHCQAMVASLQMLSSRSQLALLSSKAAVTCLSHLVLITLSASYLHQLARLPALLDREDLATQATEDLLRPQ